MTYTSNIPLANQTLASSQPQIRNNFLNLDSTVGLNHVPMSDATAADRGKHKFCVFKTQGAAPALAATESSIYTKNTGVETELFWQRQGGAEVRITGPDPLLAVNGYTFLPGRLLLQWGTFHATGGGTIDTIFFNTNFGAAAYNVQLQLIRASTSTSQTLNVISGTITAAQFKIQLFNDAGGGGGHDIFWLAIGAQV